MHTILSNPGHTIEVSPLTAGTFTLTSKDTLDATLTVTTPGTPINPTAATAAIGSSTTLATSTLQFVPNIPGANTVTINTLPTSKTFTYTATASLNCSRG